jgi:hypothetical protein
MSKLSGYKFYYSILPLWGIDRKTRTRILLNKKIGKDSLFDRTHGYFPNDLNFQGIWNSKNSIGAHYCDKYYDSLLNLANEINSCVYLITPPYSPVLNANSPRFRNEMECVFKDLSERHKNLNWIWLNDKEVFNDSSYFYNHLHLNKKGSKIYSRILGSSIKKSILKDKN